jgi:hypothetical protein
MSFYDYDSLSEWGNDLDIGQSDWANDLDVAQSDWANDLFVNSSGGSADTPRSSLYSNEAYGSGMTGEQTARYDRTLDLTGSKSLADIAASGSFSDFIKSLGGVAKDALTSKAGLAGLMALLSYLDRDKGQQYGGGTTQAYAGPSRPLTATTEQGKYGPIVRYAANGGLMQAYANGGKVQMEDGGFVMTKKAVDGAGGPRGIQQLVPGARMIGGPPDPTGRRDLTPAVIHGPKGVTPAKVSSGEAYVPKHVVDQHGGPDRMYAIMNKLQGRA